MTVVTSAHHDFVGAVRSACSCTVGQQQQNISSPPPPTHPPGVGVNNTGSGKKRGKCICNNRQAKQRENECGRSIGESSRSVLGSRARMICPVEVHRTSTFSINNKESRCNKKKAAVYYTPQANAVASKRLQKNLSIS